MYQKILIPWDGSEEARGVLPHVDGELGPDGEVVFLRIIAPEKMRAVEDENRAAVQQGCELTFRDHVSDSVKWQCDTWVSDDVVKGILDYAKVNGIDLIAMYTHDRKGLARLLQRSVAKGVSEKAAITVKVYKPGETVAAN